MPFASKKRQGAQIRRLGSVKIRESSKSIEQQISPILKKSPVKIKRPFINKRPAQKTISCKGGVNPNISARNTALAIMSITPSMRTIILFSVRKR